MKNKVNPEQSSPSSEEESKLFHVGLLHFSSEPGEEIQQVLNAIPPFHNSRGELITIEAEHIKVHVIPVDYQTKYDFIIDRSSHRLSSAVGILKMFAFRGVPVVNNPLSFWWFVDNKDAGYGMMRDLGVVRIPVGDRSFEFLSSPDIVAQFKSAIDREFALKGNRV